MNDPFFGVATAIFAGQPLGTGGEESLEHVRIRGACDRARRLQQFAAMGDGASGREEDVFGRGRRLVEVLTWPDSKLQGLEGGSAQEQRLALELREFRQLVPLVSNQKLRALISGSDAKWHHVDQGSEAMVFEAVSGDVYKLIPIRDAVLEVPPITSADEPIYARPNAHHLANQFGEPTILARVAAMNGSRGFAKTEVVGITEKGGILLKQRDLGRAAVVVLPTMRELRVWAEVNGHEVLSPQADDPHDEIEGASSLMPIVARIDGEFFIGTDIVPRNARLTSEGALVFDPVLRRLTQREIELHPEIRDAVQRLLTAKGG